MSVTAERREQLAEMSRKASEHDQREQSEQNAQARRPLYVDVEAMLTPGFLSCTLKLNGVRVALRSMSPGDMILLRHRVDTNAPTTVWKSWVLATCTWMVNGQSLLEDPYSSLQVYQAYRSMPSSAIDIMWSMFQGLQTRVSACLPRIEAFCYEHYSRALWRFCGRQSPARDEYVGIAGVARLGMNLVQRMWVSYNSGEDERIQEMSMWSGAKLIASAANPKGIKKLNAADESRNRQEESRRQRVQDKMYYDSVGWRETHAQLVFQPHSAEELVEQMRRWQDGDKDLHDIIVDAWKNKVRNVEAQKREDQKARAEERRLQQKMAEELTGKSGSGIVGYTPHQLRELMGDKSHPRQQARTRVVQEKPGNSVKFDRFLSREIEVGYMGDGGARGMELREEAVPTLNEKVAGGPPPAFRSPADMMPERLRAKLQQDMASEEARLDGGSPMHTESEEL